VRARPCVEKDVFYADWMRCISYATAKFPSHELHFGIDSNARVGSVASPCFGQAGPELENSNGTIFREHLEAQSLRADNTWHDIGSTWTSSRGLSSRIDYVSSSRLGRSTAVACMRLNDVDLTMSAFV
jgi:hypothetical protein